MATILVGVCVLVAPAAARAPRKKKPPVTKPVDKPVVEKPAADTSPDPKTVDKPADAKADAGAAVGAKEKKGGKGEKNFDFNALDLNGRMRTPQLLYFLERANEELERASLEKRSFIPHMVRSVEEEQL